MRLAIFGDIHGNLTALEAVLADIRRQGADQMICLGDLAFKGPAPGECVGLVRSLGIPCVHGNTDLGLLMAARVAGAPGLPGHLPPDSIPYLEWHLERMSQADIAYLAGLPFAHRLEADGQAVLCLHATPQNCWDVIRPFDPQEEVAARVQETAAGWLVMGHIHQPFVLRCAGRWLINAGAVGYSLDGDWRAAYALLDTRAGAITLRRVEYASEQAVALARARGFCFDPESYGAGLRRGRWESNRR